MDKEKQDLIKEYKDNLKGFNRDKPISAKEEKKKKAIKKLKLSLGLKASYGTESMNLTPALSQKINDFVYAFAEAKNLIDTISGNEKDKSEQETLYRKRVKKLATKHGSKWLKKLAKAPVTITVYQPTFALGFAWARETMQSSSTALAPVKHDVFLQAAPLFKMDGSLDLITCATFIPVAGQVIKVADMVLNVIGVEPVFKLTAMGELALAIKGTIKTANNVNESKLEREIKAGLKMSIEASITVGGGLVFSLLYKKQKEMAQAVYADSTSVQEDLEKYTVNFKRSELKIRPIENFKIQFYGNGKIVTLIRTDDKYKGEYALHASYRREDGRKRLLIYNIELHRPKAGGPLEIIR